MKNRITRLSLYFLLPTVLIGVLFTVLTDILPEKQNLWNGIIICFCLSAICYLWSEVAQNQGMLDQIDKSLSKARVFPTYTAWMDEARRVIADGKNHRITVKVYKGYSHNLDVELDYFRATINGINANSIEHYQRIMAIRNEIDARCAVAIVQLFLRECKKLEKVLFYVNYDPSPNYNSFIILGERMSLLALPNLAARPDGMIGHRCGVGIDDDKVNRSLSEIYHELGESVYNEKIIFDQLIDTDLCWKQLENAFLRKARDARNNAGKFSSGKKR